MYRDITTVEVGNGLTTSFWHDCWRQGSRLADTYEALLSHCTMQNVSVHDMLTGRWARAFVPPLSRVAVQELSEVSALLDTVDLTAEGDVRSSPLMDEAAT